MLRLFVFALVLFGVAAVAAAQDYRPYQQCPLCRQTDNSTVWRRYDVWRYRRTPLLGIGLGWRHEVYVVPLRQQLNR